MVTTRRQSDSYLEIQASDQRVFADEVREVGPAEARAGFAGALRVERAEVPPKAGVLQVEPPVGGKRRAVAGQPGRQPTVEHVPPERDDLEDADRVSDA